MKQKSCRFFLFCIYAVIMLGLLFIRVRPNTADPGFSYWEYIRTHTHLIPFSVTGEFLHLLLFPDIHIAELGAAGYTSAFNHAIRNLGGNIILFIPLGFLLPRVFPGLQRLWKTALCALAIMTCVEILQVATLLGFCDIDDLILNTLGAAIGYGLHKLLIKLAAG